MATPAEVEACLSIIPPYVLSCPSVGGFHGRVAVAQHIHPSAKLCSKLRNLDDEDDNRVSQELIRKDIVTR